MDYFHDLTTRGEDFNRNSENRRKFKNCGFLQGYLSKNMEKIFNFKNK
jgi:hypothetical protein